MTKDKKHKIEALLTFLKSKAEAYFFLDPVDWEALGLPDYPQIISEPMDFSTIQNKLDSDSYTCVEDVLDDVQMIFDNCMLYNEEHSDIFKYASKMQEITKTEVSKVFGSQMRYGQKSKAWFELQNQRKELEDFEE